MKNIFTLLIFLSTASIYSQKIVENKVDEFTKNSIIRTDWEKLYGSLDIWMSSRLSKIDDSYFIQIKIITKKVTSVSADENISFMLDNDEIINLKNIKHTISCYGCGATGLAGSQALGIEIGCNINSDDMEKFKSHTVKKIRINTSGGYLQEDINEKLSTKFKKMFLLFK